MSDYVLNNNNHIHVSAFILAIGNKVVSNTWGSEAQDFIAIISTP